MYFKKLFKLTFVLLGVVGAVSLGIFWGIFEHRRPYQEDQFKKNQDTSQPTQAWMTIFVHGTFGTAMGLLNLPEICTDSLQKTFYKKMANRMRKDPSFYQDQPILRRGLIKVTPTFDPATINNQLCAVFPLCKIYELISDFCQKHEHNYFYTYGWSGLISQHRRRLEAIRFYNAINQELESFYKQGITPKIRIISHSHGGNLCLNLAAIEKIINLPSFLTTTAPKNPTDETEALTHMFNLLKKMPNQELAFKNKGLKKFDYVPTNKHLIVDELILFGTPIQPETAAFCYATKTFKKIYSFYSDNDTIQKVDFLSTKAHQSEQRFTNTTQISGHIPNNIIQAKIMINRNWNTSNNSLTNTTNDPGHKDFWFFSWENERVGSTLTTSLKPLPIVVLTPFLSLLCDQSTSTEKDLDINIKETKESLSIMAAKHNQFYNYQHQEIPTVFLDTLKQKIAPWKPRKKSGFDLFYKMYSLFAGVRTSS
jgi:hypothetical protein